jgi:peptide methionine sulfoxide reductase MsrB
MQDPQKDRDHYPDEPPPLPEYVISASLKKLVLLCIGTMLINFHKATEPPFKGEYDNFNEDVTFICRRCNTPLFSSKSKFEAGCGWPSFDESYPNAIKRVPDPDGIRTEIECANCGGQSRTRICGRRLHR